MFLTFLTDTCAKLVFLPITRTIFSAEIVFQLLKRMNCLVLNTSIVEIETPIPEGKKSKILLTNKSDGNGFDYGIVGLDAYRGVCVLFFAYICSLLFFSHYAFVLDKTWPLFHQFRVDIKIYCRLKVTVQMVCMKNRFDSSANHVSVSYNESVQLNTVSSIWIIQSFSYYSIAFFLAFEKRIEKIYTTIFCFSFILDKQLKRKLLFTNRANY